VDVVEWFTGGQGVDPDDKRDAVDLHFVERSAVEDPVVVAGGGVAVLDHAAVLDRRLVGVDGGGEVRRRLRQGSAVPNTEHDLPCPAGTR
jgi:hypothetical protein